METGERLSAYLAGELDAGETAALEAELAGDAALRTRLERIRRANDALSSLPEVTPPAAFSEQLRASVADEIDRQAAAPQVDELARRRLQRNAGMNRFVGIGVAAAAVAVLGAFGLSNLFSADDDAGELAGGDGDAAATLQGPTDPLAAFVRVTDTDHDADSVQALAEERGLEELPARVDQDAARELEADRYGAFGLLDDLTAGGGRTEASQRADAGDEEGAGTDGEPESDQLDEADGATTGGSSTTADVPPADAPAALESGDPFSDVRRCLPEIVSTATQPAIPLYAEVASFEGEPAIIYLVLTREPGEATFGRVEAWVVGRADCFPLLFQQIAR